MKCAHDACTCTGKAVHMNGNDYCSEHCAQSDRAGDATHACHCGHDGCAGYSGQP